MKNMYPTDRLQAQLNRGNRARVRHAKRNESIIPGRQWSSVCVAKAVFVVFVRTHQIVRRVLPYNFRGHLSIFQIITRSIIQ